MKSPICLPIASVERDTGLSKDTLRVWERRYGFPAPERDAHGERLYPQAQVERLRLIKRLLDQGRRPAALMKCGDEELGTLLALGSSDARRGESGAIVGEVLALLQRHAGEELRKTLLQALLRQGLQHFVMETVAPLNAAVGEAWMRGELVVAEEHLYTEQIQNILRSAIATHAPGGDRPRILLTTFPDELHSLGLLMVEAMLVPERASCVSLGTQTPLGDILALADRGGFDVVALSFSAAFPLRQAIDGLAELRAALPPSIELWCGGSALLGRERKLQDVRVISSLTACLDTLGDWRARHVGNAGSP